LDKKELAVGDSTKVELIFSTGHYSSSVKKSARIMCNSAGTIPRLQIGADVRKSMDSLDIFAVEPYLIDLDKDRPEDQKHAWEYQFTLKNMTDADLSFTIVSQPHEYCEIDFPENKAIGPGKDKTFKIKFEKGIADDIFAKSFTIEASDEAHTRMTIPFVKSMRWGPAPTSQR
jgi:hypothetical protein